MTLREHLEAIRDRHGQGLGDLCYRCEALWPCADYVDAVAALAILDAAEKKYPHPGAIGPSNAHRLVPDASPDPQDTNT